jgi:chemotaxis protein MotB
MKLLTAKGVLAKVAKVVNDKPDFECIEGHTDNVPYIGTGILLDNWDLIKRSTSIIRVLTNQLGVKPEFTIAGRSSYIPLVANDTLKIKRNRRTCIVVLPKIDQFYDMIEKKK